MKPDWTLEKLGILINGKIYGRSELPVSNLSIDSRTLAPYGETLFVALTGEQHDGHHYIGELYSRGIRAFLVSTLPDYKAFPEAGFCHVNVSAVGCAGR